MLASAQANTITGGLWKVDDATTATEASPANVPSTPADVTFDVNSPFNFSGENVDVGTWLASSSAFNIVENTAGTLDSRMSDSITGTIVEFTGFVTVTSGQQFTVTHDDGLTLIIGGVNLGFNDGPTAPTTSVETYNGPSGTFPFQLVYAECYSGPAVLQVDLPFSNNPVPEGGATIGMLAIGLLGLVKFARRG